MATINGTTANDVIVGTTTADTIDGGAGNDRVNGGAGDDLILGNLGDDTLTGDAGNDTLRGGEGNDGFFGGGGSDLVLGENGNDNLFGDSGDDTLDGGAGVNRVDGGTGNDTIVVRVSDHGTNTITGGSGADAVRIEFVTGEVTAAVRADLAAYNAFLQANLATAGSATALAAQTTAPTFTFASLGITVSAVEALTVTLNGTTVPLSQLLNTAPVTAASASVTTDEDRVVTGQVVATDAEGDALAYAVTQGPANGALVLDAATGTYTYTPSADFNGADTFTVRVADPTGAFTTQVVSVGVAAVNDAPVVANPSVSLAIDEDKAISGQVVASDIEGDVLDFTVANGPAHGALALDAATGAYTYTPGQDFNGADNFTVQVADGRGGTATQVVWLGVAAANDTPVVAAATAALTTDEDKAISGQVVATDVDGDVLGYTVANGPANGALALDAKTGAYSYTPGQDFNGADSFSVQVADGRGGFTTQTIAVGLTAVNDAPVVTAATASLVTDEDKAISGQVATSDVEGDVLGFTVANGPAHGALALDAATGSYTYTPGQNFNGADSFTVQVADGNGGFATQLVSVGVAAVNDGPVVATPAVRLTTAEDRTVVGQVVAADSDGDVLGFAIATGPASGAVVLDAATGAYTYTPGQNFNGADTFSVHVADGQGGFATQSISVGVNAVNDAPVVAAATVALATAEDRAVSGRVVATDVEGDVLGFTATRGPANGTLALDAGTGAYTYTPGQNFSGADTFTVQIADGNGGLATQTVQVGVSAVADAPTLSVTNQVIDLNSSTVLIGSRNADVLRGTIDGGRILGGAGNDTITVGTTVTANLGIAAALTDLDRSEGLSIAVGGIPAGGTLSAGQAGPNGTWLLTAADLANLQITASSAADFTLHVTATATEATGDLASISRDLSIKFNHSQGTTTIEGGTGSDAITGGANGDTIYGGSAPSGTIRVPGIASEKDNDIIHGGDGNDTIYGQNGNDQLFGDGGNDFLSGGQGADILYGGAGNNTINGNSGNDTIVAGGGNDTVAGGTGFDTFDFSGATSGITIDVSKGTVVGYGTSTFSGIEGVIGTAFADNYTGSSAANTLLAGAGNDTIRGLGGADTLTGGAGNDTFVYTKKDVGGIDHITDFAVGDRLDLQDFLKSARFSAIGDVVHVTDSGEGSLVSVRSGAGFVDLVVLDGIHNQSAQDLLSHGHILI